MSHAETLVLDEDLTIYHALEQKKTLLDALAHAPALMLDLSRVNEIDTAGLQLLLALERSAQVEGKSLALLAASPSVSQLLAFCNLQSHPALTPLQADSPTT